MDLTTNEKLVIEAYKKDDYVGDYGWDSIDAGTWIKDFHEDCGLNGKIFSGTMSSLVKKGIVVTNGESFSLTVKGIEVAGSV